MKSFLILAAGFSVLAGFSIAFGAVPSRITDDTAIYQKLSEIKAPPHRELNFDADIDHLSQLQPRYKETLPSLSRVSGPIQRISQRQYHYSGIAPKKALVINGMNSK